MATARWGRIEHTGRAMVVRQYPREKARPGSGAAFVCSCEPISHNSGSRTTRPTRLYPSSSSMATPPTPIYVVCPRPGWSVRWAGPMARYNVYLVPPGCPLPATPGQSWVPGARPERGAIILARETVDDERGRLRVTATLLTEAYARGCGAPPMVAEAVFLDRLYARHQADGGTASVGGPVLHAALPAQWASVPAGPLPGELAARAVSQQPVAQRGPLPVRWLTGLPVPGRTMIRLRGGGAPAELVPATVEAPGVTVVLHSAPRHPRRAGCGVECWRETLQLDDQSGWQAFGQLRGTETTCEARAGTRTMAVAAGGAWTERWRPGTVVRLAGGGNLDEAVVLVGSRGFRLWELAFPLRQTWASGTAVEPPVLPLARRPATHPVARLKALDASIAWLPLDEWPATATPAAEATQLVRAAWHARRPWLTCDEGGADPSCNLCSTRTGKVCVAGALVQQVVGSQLRELTQLVAAASGAKAGGPVPPGWREGPRGLHPEVTAFIVPGRCRGCGDYHIQGTCSCPGGVPRRRPPILVVDVCSLTEAFFDQAEASRAELTAARLQAADDIPTGDALDMLEHRAAAKAVLANAADLGKVLPPCMRALCGEPPPPRAGKQWLTWEERWLYAEMAAFVGIPAEGAVDVLGPLLSGDPGGARMRIAGFTQAHARARARVRSCRTLARSGTFKGCAAWRTCSVESGVQTPLSVAAERADAAANLNASE